MDGSRDGKRAGNDAATAGDIVLRFVTAPPFGDPANFLHVDALPVRDTLDAAVDTIRAASGLPPISAAAFRQRRANSHLAIAAEYVKRRREGKDASNDEVCRGVQAALDMGVVGACAYCGCNFSVVAVKVVVGTGVFCGLCQQPLRTHEPAPMVRPTAPNVEERFKGWTPW